MPYIDKANIKRGQTLKGEFTEIDLTQAYWNLAFINKIISEKTYLFANNPKISKKARLIALGTLAKRVRSIKFNGEMYEGVPIENEAETARLFYFCCMEVSKFMQDLKQMAGADFLFYWVDAIFLRNGDASRYAEIYLDKLHAELLKEHPNLHKQFYKKYKINKVKRNKSALIIYSTDHKNKERIFNFEKPKKHVLI